MHKSTRNLSIREGTATGLSCNNVSTCAHFSFPSCHCQFISIMSLKGCCNKNRWCDAMWHDVWGGEGRLLLHLQIPKNTLVGRSEELYWHTCVSLFSPCSPLLLSYRRPCLKLGRTALNRSHQLMGSCFEWRRGREGVLYLTDVWIVAIWSEKGQFFVGVSQHFCICLKLSLTTLPKLNLETSIPVRPSGWYFIFFTASKSWKPST